MATENTATPDDTGADTGTEQDSVIVQVPGTVTDGQDSTDKVNGDNDGGDLGTAPKTDTDSADDVDTFDYDEVMSNYTEFTLPEGVDQATLDDVLKEMAPLFKKMGVDQEEAQMLLDHTLGKLNPESQTQASDKWEAQVKEWSDSIAADKEVGGDKLEQSNGYVNSMLKHFGSEEVNKILEDTGLRQHPAMFKMMRAIGAAMREDNPGAGAKPTGSSGDRVSNLYPES